MFAVPTQSSVLSYLSNTCTYQLTESTALHSTPLPSTPAPSTTEQDLWTSQNSQTSQTLNELAWNLNLNLNLLFIRKFPYKSSGFSQLRQPPDYTAHKTAPFLWLKILQNRKMSFPYNSIYVFRGVQTMGLTVRMASMMIIRASYKRLWLSMINFHQLYPFERQ